MNGRVIDFFAPVANASILVDGKATTTAADGTFSVTGVHTPYDVTMSFQGNTDVWVYQGLSRTDPTLQIFGTTTGYQATVSGSIGTAPYQTGEVGAVFAAGTAVAYGGAGVQSGTTTFGPGAIRWGPNDPLPLTLYGIRALTDSSGIPTSFTGFGSLTLTLHNGDALTGLSVPTTPVMTASLSGTLTAPSGYNLTDGRAVIRFGPSTGGALVGLALASVTPSGSFSNAMVPVAPGISYGLAARATDASNDAVVAWGSVTAPNTAAKLTLPSASQPTAPAAGATNVGPGTTFSWTPLAGSVYVISISPKGSTGPHVYLVTAGTSTTLPDLSAVNRALPANAPYNVNVLALGPLASVNAAAGPSGSLADYIDVEVIFSGGSGSGPQGVSGPDQPSWFTSSGASTFTTAP